MKVDPVEDGAPSALPAAPDAQDELDIREALKTGRELEQSEDQPAPKVREDEPVPGLKFLTGIMKATFFTDLFCYHADIRYAHPTRSERVSAHMGANPVFYKWCRNADLVSRICLMAVVVGVAGSFAWGTVQRLLY